MLKVDSIDVYYGDVQILRSASLQIHEGELVAVIGANGAGKTTLLNTISGLLKPRRGQIVFNGVKISDQESEHIVSSGLVQVPEGRLLFPQMTVRENLAMGAYLIKDKKVRDEGYEHVCEIFPVLYERQNQLAGTLSGGEQQMLAIGRALMASPKLIMFDEPSLGLAPILVMRIFELIEKINRDFNVTVLLVEQNVQQSCEISSRAYVVENGEVVLEGSGTSLLNNDHVRKAYLGL